MPSKLRVTRREFPKRTDRRLTGVFFSVSFAKNTENKPKFTCVVSKKIAPRSVIRNTIKRRSKAIFYPLMKNALCTVLVYPKRAAETASFIDLKNEAVALMDKITNRQAFH